MPETVTAIVLNWNDYDGTAECIKSLQKLEYELLEILVVDNGSNDLSGRQIKSDFPSVNVLFNQENLGFGGGMNSGIKYAMENNTDYIWVLNNDITIENEETLGLLVNKLNRNEEAGAISPLIEEPNGDLWFAEGFIDTTTGESRHRVTNVGDLSSSQLENDYIPACCTLFQSNMLKKVGLFDEDFFIYYDDVDHGIRARQEGYTLITAANCHIVHKGSATSERTGGTIQPYYSARNRWILTRKHSFNQVSFITDHIHWAIYYFFYYSYNKKFASAYALLLGMLDGLLGRVGKGRYP